AVNGHQGRFRHGDFVTARVNAIKQSSSWPGQGKEKEPNFFIILINTKIAKLKARTFVCPGPRFSRYVISYKVQNQRILRRLMATLEDDSNEQDARQNQEHQKSVVDLQG